MTSTYVQEPTRYLVTNYPMYDSALGKEGGVMCIYSGYVRKHVWASKSDELLMDGSGRAVMPNGDTYEGDFRLGMFEGMGVMRYSNGDLYDGQWESHLRHGYGVMEYADGRSFSGIFKEGEKSGAGADMGKVDAYSGSYRNGMANGPGRLQNSETGEVIDGLFRNGRMHGMCTITYRNGDYYVGTFKDGLPHGKGKYVLSETKDEFLEEFEEGKCVVGVLEPTENAVLATASTATCLEQAPNQLQPHAPTYNPEALPAVTDMNLATLATSPSKQRLCHAKYKGSGDEYVGGWKRAELGTGNRRGTRQGHGTLIIKETGAVYVGEFNEDMMEGDGDMTFPPSAAVCASPDKVMQSYKGGFFRNQFHGKAAVTYANGVTTEQFFCRGQPHGISHEQQPEATRTYSNEMASMMYDPTTAPQGAPVDYHLRGSADAVAGPRA